MADEQNTQTTQATEQTAALSGGGDPTTSTQSFAQNILGDVNPDGIVRKTGEQLRFQSSGLLLGCVRAV